MKNTKPSKTREVEESTRVRLGGLLVGIAGCSILNDEQGMKELVESFIKGNTALFDSKLKEEYERGREEGRQEMAKASVALINTGMFDAKTAKKLLKTLEELKPKP